MAGTARKTDPELWNQVKQEITDGAKGGRPGQWSARKAQMAAQAYKQAGGGYAGPKAPDNHLAAWQREQWGTGSGRNSSETGERYLPKAARTALTPEEYHRSSAAKRADTRAGRQFSPQPPDIAAKAAGARHAAGVPKATLMAEARQRGIAGRSRMSKQQLAEALRQAG